MTRSRSPGPAETGAPHRARRIHEENAGKHPELAGCPRCGTSYRNGRWTSQAPPVGVHEMVCPACQRIEQDDPAGILRVEGGFVAGHREELIGLLRNVEERERSEHPLKRIMSIRDEDEGLSVAVTDAKLVRAFGRALFRAYEGELEQPPTTAEQNEFARGRWRRD